MTPLEAIILGVVEGITEYLPISSTGHLILTTRLLGLDEPEETRRAVDTFTIVVQGGAILAVLGLYWARVRSMLAGIFGRDADGRRLFLQLLVAFAPAAILGPLLDDHIESMLFGTYPVIAALALGGIAMIALGPRTRRDAGREITTLTFRAALIIGLMQCIAMWPGMSRSMMTIVGGILVGLRPRAAAEFSFLLGLPTLGGACAYKLTKDLTGDGESMFAVLDTGSILIGITVATVSAALAVKWLVGYLTKHGLAIFGWYRIVLAIIVLLVMAGNGNTNATEPTEEESPAAVEPG